MKPLAGVFLCAILMSAQQPVTLPAFSRPGVSPDVDAVVIGNITAATREPNETMARGSLQVERTLSGTLDSDPITVVLPQDRDPMHGTRGLKAIPSGRAIFFLGRSGDAFDVIPPNSVLDRDYYILIPGSLPAELRYADDAPLGRKLAAELVFAMEQFAEASGDRLNVTHHYEPTPWIQSSVEALTFDQLTRVWQLLSREDQAVFAQRLSGAPYPAVRAVGLSLRLREKRAEAIEAIRADLARLAPATSARLIADEVRAMRSTPVSQEDVQELSRLATSEVAELPGLESAVLDLLSAWSHSDSFPYIEFVPFQIAELRSPDPHVREFAALTLCAEFQASSGRGLERFQTQAMKQVCPKGFEDRNYPAMIAYWKGWWSTERLQLPEFATLPEFAVPSRFAP